MMKQAYVPKPKSKRKTCPICARNKTRDYVFLREDGDKLTCKRCGYERVNRDELTQKDNELL